MSDSQETEPRPVPYHLELCEALRELEPGLWRWFASDEYGEKHAEQVRVELLKNTYRLPRDAHAELYATGDEVARSLELAAPLTLYQAQDAGVMNAGLFFVPGELHVVLQGPISRTLCDLELRALLGHELAHYKLLTEAGGTFHVMNELIEHIVANAQASPSHVQSALRNRRWIELYADRGSLTACNDLHASVACLVKVSTGLETVDAAAYLVQADEVVSKSKRASEGTTHPETFMRALALKKWQEKGAEAEPEIRSLVEGPLEVTQLDLIQQRRFTATTRGLLCQVLRPSWYRTDTNMAHARRFFADFTLDESELRLEAETMSESMADYFCYVLLDFAAVDRELEDAALAHIIGVADGLGLGERFEELARKELKLTVKAFKELRQRAPDLVRAAETQHEAAS